MLNVPINLARLIYFVLYDNFTFLLLDFSGSYKVLGANSKNVVIFRFKKYFTLLLVLRKVKAVVCYICYALG